MYASSLKACAIVVAAGESRRMNGVDKILAPLSGKPVLAWSLETLQQSPCIDRIVVVNQAKNLETVRCLAIDQKWSKVIDVCVGGQRRQDSVAAGLALLENCEWVLIHDGARPLLTADLIERGIQAAQETGSAIAAVPVKDTIKLVSDAGIVLETPLRSLIWAVQTPQIFRLPIIKEAYKQATSDVTDDASLVEQLGYKVKVFLGSFDNIKITTPSDLDLASWLIGKASDNGK